MLFATEIQVPGLGVQKTCKSELSWVITWGGFTLF